MGKDGGQTSSLVYNQRTLNKVDIIYFMKKIGFKALFILNFFTLFFISACTPVYETPLKVGSNNWLGYRPLYYGIEQGTVSTNDLKMIEFGSSTDVSRAFRNGNLNGACLTMDEVILLASEGFKPRVVLAFDESAGADALLVNPAKKHMKGLKIGVEQGALGAFVLSRAVEKMNLPLPDISIINLQFDQHEEAYRSRKVDGVITFEPVRSRIIEMGGKMVFDSSMIPGEIVDLLVFSEETIKTQPKKVQSIVNGWFKSLSAFQADRRYLQENNLKPSQFGLKYQGMAENLGIFKVAKKENIAKFQKIEKVMLEQKLIKNNVQWEEIFVNQFVVSSSGPL